MQSALELPLAIFMGQVAATLATGNTVLANLPPGRRRAWHWKPVKLMHAAGIPVDALQLLHGAGETGGRRPGGTQPPCGSVVFTGSTRVAKIIQRALAAKDGPIVPLIAETGGINAMLVDSSALPEQLVDAVVQKRVPLGQTSAAGLRLLCARESIADGVIAMLQGLRRTGGGRYRRPGHRRGAGHRPQAYDNIQRHHQRLHAQAKGTGSPRQSGW